MAENNDTSRYGIVIHGGAGTITRDQMTPEKEDQYREALTESLEAGFGILEAGGTALNAIQKAVNVMEDSPLFNAGKGAVFTHDGKNEQDACIMDGATLRTGAVGGVRRVKRPIDLARLIMEKSEHVFMIGNGAEEFAKAHGMELVDVKYFHTERRWQQLQRAIEREKTGTEKKEPGTFLDHDKTLGTVGAVAWDKHGHLAVATSSGGMTNKRFGRVGDSASNAASSYANDKTCAVSTTGQGEYFIRAVTAYDVHAMMEYKGLSLKEAVRIAIHEKLTALGGTGGLIAIDAKGNWTWAFNTEGMYRGRKMAGGELVVEIYEETAQR